MRSQGRAVGNRLPPKCCLACCCMAMPPGCGVSRKIERAAFRRTFLPELKDLFVQVLLLAQEAGVLKLGTISLDGTKVHAGARHSQSGQLQTGSVAKTLGGARWT